MNFLRLPDSLLSVLFEDDDIIAIDKPYGFNAHTNDSKIEHSEFIQDGLIEIYEKQLGKKLHIVHRLDQTTTGVMIFGKSVESAKKYADFFFARQVKKTYWFITQSSSNQDQFLIEKEIIHKGRELDAKTQLSLIKKDAGFELWKANPLTGRNHQIRIHAQAAGISILGDSKYDGAKFSFLCLHNHRIEFPNGIVIKSVPPIYFEQLDLLKDPILAKTLFETDRRLRLFAGHQKACFRLVHIQKKSQEPGFTLDHLGQNLILNWYKDWWASEDQERFMLYGQLMKKPLIVRFMNSKGSTSRPALVLGNAESVWTAQENDVRYELKSEGGLFLNQRLQRQWVRNNSEGKTVLNLFGSTGGFAVNAAIGKAQEVVMVEMSKGALQIAKRNFELNGVVSTAFKFLCRDSLSFLEQIETKKAKYDMIICDCPSFFRREKGVFKIESGFEALTRQCLSCLKPGGTLLLSTNFEGLFIDDIRKMILRAQKSLGMTGLEIQCVLASLDFELPDETTNLKSFIIQN